MNNRSNAAVQLETTQELWPLDLAVGFCCALGAVLFVRPVSLAAPETIR